MSNVSNRTDKSYFSFFYCLLFDLIIFWIFLDNTVSWSPLSLFSYIPFIVIFGIWCVVKHRHFEAPNIFLFFFNYVHSLLNFNSLFLHSLKFFWILKTFFLPLVSYIPDIQIYISSPFCLANWLLFVHHVPLIDGWSDPFLFIWK